MQQVYGPYQQYKRQKEHDIQSASRVKLVVMLLEGAICFNKKAAMAVEANNKVAILENIDRANKIVMHLYESLNFDQGSKISEQLASLYSYICDRYTKFVKGKMDDLKDINSINTVLGTLLEAWKKIEANEKNAG